MEAEEGGVGVVVGGGVCLREQHKNKRETLTRRLGWAGLEGKWDGMG